MLSIGAEEVTQVVWPLSKVQPSGSLGSAVAAGAMRPTLVTAARALALVMAARMRMDTKDSWDKGMDPAVG
ncbi:hypothetical protein GCM10027596_16690 [Nocardioides korecus]